MRVVIVDDDQSSSMEIKNICQSLDSVITCNAFHNPYEALIYIVNEKPNVVFLNIDMPELYGVEVAKAIRKNSANTAIAFITESEKHALDAFRLDAIAYLMKPIKTTEIINAMLKAQQILKPVEQKVFIRTFGRFDLFIDQEPVHFKNAKAKELLALLVDKRGGTVTKELAINVLWDNRRYDDNVKQLYRKAVAYLHKVFTENNIDFFISHRGSCYVKTSDYECDYYLLMDGNEKALSAFNGEYMFDYGWAEPTLAQIEKHVDNWNKTNNRYLVQMEQA